jgi:hypothetical protein
LNQIEGCYHQLKAGHQVRRQIETDNIPNQINNRLYRFLMNHSQQRKTPMISPPSRIISRVSDKTDSSPIPSLGIKKSEINFAMNRISQIQNSIIHSANSVGSPKESRKEFQSEFKRIEIMKAHSGYQSDTSSDD